MAIQTTGGKIHWNYFLALERDLESASRYVEFCDANYEVYSIEFAHLLFAAASEVDVVAKLLCERFASGLPAENIIQYRTHIIASNALPDLLKSEVFIPRYGVRLTPWVDWKQNSPPIWWTSYNKVKHERDVHFAKATLKNALNALAALLLLTYHHYRFALAPGQGLSLSVQDTTELLQPEPALLRLPKDHYRSLRVTE
jgi:hypothetical protein